MDLIDSHAHLYWERFDADRDAVIARARAEGFTGVINIGTDLATTAQALGLAREHPGYCWATAGLHPTECALDADELARVVTALEEIVIRHPREIRAIGEIGLDYHWDRATPAEQERAFRAQLALAERCDRAVVIHCREAMPETLAIVAEHASRMRGVFHCFAGNARDAERVLELGWYISFAGNVTYPKAGDLREAALTVPPERLLLETDAPFLAPQPVRGQRNEPAFARHTLEFLASLYGMSAEDLGGATTAASRALFVLPEPA